MFHSKIQAHYQITADAGVNPIFNFKVTIRPEFMDDDEEDTIYDNYNLSLKDINSLADDTVMSIISELEPSHIGDGYSYETNNDYSGFSYLITTKKVGDVLVSIESKDKCFKDWDHWYDNGSDTKKIPKIFPQKLAQSQRNLSYLKNPYFKLESEDGYPYRGYSIGYGGDYDFHIHGEGGYYYMYNTRRNKQSELDKIKKAIDEIVGKRLESREEKDKVFRKILRIT